MPQEVYGRVLALEERWARLNAELVLHEAQVEKAEAELRKAKAQVMFDRQLLTELHWELDMAKQRAARGEA